MEIVLSPEAEDQIRVRVESGQYRDAAEVVAASLRLMVEHDHMLREEVLLGHRQILDGEGIPVDGENAFMELVRGR